MAGTPPSKDSPSNIWTRFMKNREKVDGVELNKALDENHPVPDDLVDKVNDFRLMVNAVGGRWKGKTQSDAPTSDDVSITFAIILFL